MRIEHAQHMKIKDFKPFKQLNVIAFVQPYHYIDDHKWAIKRIGKNRMQTSYDYKRFLDNKIHVAFGTDWPVAPLNPMLTIYAALMKKVKIEQAIYAYTFGSAYAEFQEHEKGSITKGKLADIIILDQNILNIAKEKILETNVMYTILGGKIIYQR